MTGIGKSTPSTFNSLDNPDQRKVTVSLVERYGLDVQMDDFTADGVVVHDAHDRKVGAAFGVVRGGLVHTGKPYADIMVIGTRDGLLIGWLQAEKMTDANDRFLVSLQALNPMPTKFDFAQPCPHMSVYGGYLDNEENNWRCFGCDKIIPFVG
jgi:hypothetical protein